MSSGNQRKTAIFQQISSNRDANVLYPAAPEMLTIDNHFLEALEDAISSVPPDEIDALLDYAVDECIKKVLAINQFLQIDDNAKQKLTDIYKRTWQLIKHATDPVSVLRGEHFTAIQVWVSQLYPPAMVKSLEQQRAVRPVCCSEYSAELQLQVLGIIPGDIREPVLDIGCGYGAPLVKYLADQGVDVFGFDRLVEEETDRVSKADWFTFDYSRKAWGTIISHMSFSNHYRYALHYDQDLRCKLSDVFQRIIASLAPGGSFAYTPGTDELDRLADPCVYGIENSRVVGNFTSTQVTRRV